MKLLLKRLLKALAIATSLSGVPAWMDSPGKDGLDILLDDWIGSEQDRFRVASNWRDWVPSDLRERLTEQELLQIVEFAQLGGKLQPVACGAVLEAVLSTIEGFDRTYVISELATSTQASSRLALAHAFSHSARYFAALSALALLSQDEDARVRAVAEALLSDATV